MNICFNKKKLTDLIYKMIFFNMYNFYTYMTQKVLTLILQIHSTLVRFDQDHSCTINMS